MSYSKSITWTETSEKSLAVAIFELYLDENDCKKEYICDGSLTIKVNWYRSTFLQGHILKLGIRKTSAREYLTESLFILTASM